MSTDLRLIREWRGIDVATFRGEIVPRGEPAVMRGLTEDWPAVQAGRRSPWALGEYIKSFDRGTLVETLTGDPSIKGRFFYSDDLKGLNFEKRPERISTTIDRLLAQPGGEGAPSLYIQSASIPDCLPGFAGANGLSLPGGEAVPRVWIGNAVTVSTHYDLSENIACVVGGRRRFTLFPPGEIGNLYVGPIHFTLAGQPVSMVALDEPDFERYPRFRDALASAQTAELEPGDAIYIPYFWWHHVRSLTSFNVLVNYWWNDAEPRFGLPYDALLHAFLTIRHLPPDQRAAWRGVFDHYVFETGGDPVAHLPKDARGALGPMTPGLAAQIKAALLRRLNRS
jgi:hypothetical protein